MVNGRKTIEMLTETPSTSSPNVLDFIVKCNKVVPHEDSITEEADVLSTTT